MSNSIVGAFSNGSLQRILGDVAKKNKSEADKVCNIIRGPNKMNGAVDFEKPFLSLGAGKGLSENEEAPMGSVAIDSLTYSAKAYHGRLGVPFDKMADYEADGVNGMQRMGNRVVGMSNLELDLKLATTLASTSLNTAQAVGTAWDDSGDLFEDLEDALKATMGDTIILSRDALLAAKSNAKLVSTIGQQKLSGGQESDSAVVQAFKAELGVENVWVVEQKYNKAFPEESESIVDIFEENAPTANEGLVWVGSGDYLVMVEPGVPEQKSVHVDKLTGKRTYDVNWFRYADIMRPDANRARTLTGVLS